MSQQRTTVEVGDMTLTDEEFERIFGWAAVKANDEYDVWYDREFDKAYERQYGDRF